MRGVLAVSEKGNIIHYTPSISAFFEDWKYKKGGRSVFFFFFFLSLSSFLFFSFSFFHITLFSTLVCNLYG